MMRLNKYVAHCGIASRRKAAELVKAGYIKVNGSVETNPAIEIDPEQDTVEYKGQAIHVEEKKVYILLNKPKNTVTTTDDEKGRRTVMDVIGNRVKERIYPVGRLDKETVGLLLLTNDGDLAKKLSHPSHEVTKIYRVFLNKEITKSDIIKIRDGLTLEDGYSPVDALNYVERHGKEVVDIKIHIGRNRIVRRIFSHLGYEVIKLDRIFYAGLTKKDLPRGWSRPLTDKEVIMLKHFV